MSHGATFLKGNYELPRGPVKLSRERWRMLERGPLGYGCVSAEISKDRIVLPCAQEIEGVIFLPAEYVPAETSLSEELKDVTRRWVASHPPDILRSIRA